MRPMDEDEYGPVSPVVRPKFHDDWRCVHIDPTARIGEKAFIGHGVVIGPNVVIEDGASIWHYANLLEGARVKKDAMVAYCCQIERNVVIGERSRIQPFAAPGSGTVIGNDVYYGPYTCNANAPYPPCKRLHGGVVEDGAIVGMGVYIFPGMTIGKRAVVGTGSKVRHDIPAEEVWYGDPIAFAYSREEYDRRMKQWDEGRHPPHTTPKVRRVHSLEYGESL